MPILRHRQQRLLRKPKLKLSELTDLVSKDDLCRKLFDEAVNEWGTYFQSPVNKVARTSKPDADEPTGVRLAFQFDEWGAFQDRGTNFTLALADLFHWITSEEAENISEWLNRGEPLSPGEVHLVARKLFGRRRSLTNDSLYNLPVCRLVHRNQLRRDLDYQVIYQLTPAQSRLINPDDDGASQPRSLQGVMQSLRQNQRVYWGISETLQSLVAMFDSDLGSRKDSRAGRERFTKELVRITTRNGEDSSIAPDELNESSPLRFWSPPPSFAGSVFHMLFWRSVITGRDLFGRHVITSDLDNTASPKERASHYCVIINWFNAAKFRLADYGKLFGTLMAIAQKANTAKIKSSGGRVEYNTPLLDLNDVDLSGDPSGELLYPTYFPDSAVKFPQFREVNLTLPFASVGKKTMELAWEHQHNKDRQTRFSDVRKFLRDKALELILWSKYQMEIRSVGLIPIQYLYHVELTGDDNGVLHDLSVKSKLLDEERRTDPNSTAARKLEQDINKPISDAIASGDIDRWVSLKRVYGGTYRTIFNQKEWRKIALIKSPRLKAVLMQDQEAKDDDSSSTSTESDRKRRRSKGDKPG